MSLQVWLPLINDIHNQGTSSCIPESSGISTDTAGKIGSCQYLSGAATSYINTNYSTNIGTNDFSIAMWLKLPTISSGSYFAICSSKTAAGASAGFGIYWNYSQKKFLWSTADGSAGTEIWMATAVDSIVYDKWIHLVMVRNNNDSKKGYFYINGTRYELTSTPAIRNITTDTKMYIGKCTNGSYPTKMYINDFRIYDHALSAAEVKEISQGLVLHYPLNRNSLKPIGTNLVTGVTKGGQTSLLTDGRVGVVTSGTSADTYFTVNLSESITNGTTYYLSCDVSGVSEGQYWGFPLGAQNNTSMPSKFYNGHNEYIFTANDINWGANRLFLDDNYRNDYAHPASFYNFVLIKNPTFEEVDGSGYNHHGSTTENLIFNSETGRYSSSTKLNSPSPTDNSETGITYILSPLALTTPNQMTVAWWAKPESGYGGGTSHAAFCTSVNSRPTDYNATAMHHRDAGFDLCPNSGSSIRLTFNQYTANQWHHYAITYNGQKAIAYKDGTKLTEASMSAAGPLKSFTGLWIGYSQAGGVKRKTLGSYSDFRVYVTALSAADILELYHTGAKIDNKANFHAYEINENGINKLTKTGIMYDNMIESIKVLPDGSCWQLLLFHYVDGGNNLFTSSNATDCNEFGLYSRLKDINNFTYNGKYEFYVIQDDIEYRWTQTNQPTASAIAGLTAVSGYTNPVNGLAKSSQSNTYIGYNSWWGACGCWTKYSTGGKTGIPGFGSHDANGICTRYLALYARISKANVKLSNQTANASEFLEL